MAEGSDANDDQSLLLNLEGRIAYSDVPQLIRESCGSSSVVQKQQAVSVGHMEQKKQNPSKGTLSA